MNPTLPGTHSNRLNDRLEAASPPATSRQWETEVVVLRGDDRADLRQQVGALADFLGRTPAVKLKDVAFTFNTALASGGSRLSIVAESIADLRARLARAGERLADPRCRQIKDSR